MEALNIKSKFIELRAGGLSFDKIAKELNKSKQTLIDWSKEFKEEIANCKAMELELLQEKFFLSTQKRIEKFGGILKRLGEELSNRNLSDVPTEKLLDLYLKYDTKAKEEYIEPIFKSSLEIEEEKEDRNFIEFLSNPPKQSKLKIG